MSEHFVEITDDMCGDIQETTMFVWACVLPKGHPGVETYSEGHVRQLPMHLYRILQTKDSAPT